MEVETQAGSGCSVPNHTVLLSENEPIQLQSISFASLSPLCLKKQRIVTPGIVAVCRIILLAWAVLRHDSSVDESNVLRWMCGCQSPHRCGYLLYFAITDSSLRLGTYDPNKNFHRILPFEYVSNKSDTFVLPNWGKKYYNKSCYQWWLYLMIG